MRTRDPRSARTVAALEAALRESLRHGSLDDVSVSSLCRSAGIQRTSFYTHFVSVADLATHILIDDIEGALELPQTDDLSTAELAEEFQRTLVAAFQIVQVERPLFRAAFASDASAVLRRSLTNMLDTRLTGALKVWAHHGVALEIDVPVARAFTVGGLVASIEAWAASNETDAPTRAASVRDQIAPWWPRP